jgi:hypothetical protein
MQGFIMLYHFTIYSIILLLGSHNKVNAQYKPPTINIGQDSSIALVYSDDSTYHIVLKKKNLNNKITTVHLSLEPNSKCDVKHQLSKLKDICSLKKIKDDLELDTIIIYSPFCSDELKAQLINLQCSDPENIVQMNEKKYYSIIKSSDLLTDYRNTFNQMGYSILNIVFLRNRVLKEKTDIDYDITCYNLKIPCNNVLTSLVIIFTVERKR